MQPVAVVTGQTYFGAEQGRTPHPWRQRNKGKISGKARTKREIGIVDKFGLAFLDDIHYTKSNLMERERQERL